MTEQETIKLFAVIAAAYPRDKAFAEATAPMVALWTKLLADIPLAAAEAAIASHVSTSPFPPSIAEIREWAAGGPGDGAGADAWGKLMQAVRKFGWCNQAEAKEFLGPDIWGAMGSPPRVRGTARHGRGSKSSGRITPACAGNSLPVGKAVFGIGDHPRVCGEQSILAIAHPPHPGSPPRVRGTVNSFMCTSSCDRITPACAGNSEQLVKRRKPQ